jgi:hypothetical protein
MLAILLASATAATLVERQQGGEPGPMSCAMDLGIADYG